jgi:hypothetical protein
LNLAAVGKRLAGASLDELKATADHLARKLTYLLEPISPIEIDVDRCIVQMRSNPPQKDAAGASYYELLLDRTGRVSLRRYGKAPGAERRPMAAHVTREVLIRLAGDLASVA